MLIYHRAFILDLNFAGIILNYFKPFLWYKLK